MYGRREVSATVRTDEQGHRGTHMNKEYKDVDGRKVGPYGQGHMYSDSHIDVCLKLKRTVYEYETEHKTSSVQHTIRHTGREESIHTRHKLIEAGKQIRNVREEDRGYYC